MIDRMINIKNLLKQQKVLIIYGPRRVGKTTLLNDFVSNSDKKIKLDSGDNIRTQSILNSSDFRTINDYISGYDILAIDEAQQIKGIGMGLKILVDNNPNLSIIATGSSSFNLSQKISEPLTGRKNTVMLYPFYQKELLNLYNKFELKENLEEFLIYGLYPEVILANNKNQKKDILLELVNSYLLKDVLSLENIRGAEQIFNLLKLLAFQVGSEVSYNEIASNIKMDVKTVIKYIDLLEKGFIIYRHSPLSRNLRSEITKKSKYYFLDTGIRNGIILQFNEFGYRNDIGQLFENFIMTERLKYRVYNKTYKKMYFWRKYQSGEIDLVEEGDGKFDAYEIKWSKKAKVKKQKSFFETYTNSTFNVIDSNNYLDFVL
ncbi:MAG TPA: ATP-binding protein [Ignavibacteria bacterium]|nr:ATP-binding protein [Ignavibacteria bacterium]